MSRTLPRPKIITAYDIPYVAGYSVSGRIVYIDKDVPRTLVIGDVKLDLHFVLALHEQTEVQLIEEFGLNYQTAHAMSERAEEEYVKMKGVDVQQYDQILNMYIDAIGKKQLFKCPKDLDLQPYIDSNDERTITRIRKAQQW